MKKKFPQAHTVLLIIAALVALLTWIVPAGEFDTIEYVNNNQNAKFVYNSENRTIEYPANQETLDQIGLKINISKFENGDILKPIGIPGSYHELASNPQGIIAFIQSPLKGIIEIIDIILLVLIIGGLIGVMNYTGAFDAGISKLTKKLKGREHWLIILITTLIAIGGTTIGMAEETIAFYPILVPVFLVAGYDAMVVLASISIGSFIGTMASTTNPFSTIIASDSAGINWTSGLYGRIFMLITGLIICLWYIIRYAEKVRKDPTKSFIFNQKEEIDARFKIKIVDKPSLNKYRFQIIMIIFSFSFLAMIIGVSQFDWWFLEMTSVFFVASLLIGFVAKINEKTFITQFVSGANDLLSVALIIGLARGITIIMNDGLISGTILFYASTVVEGMPKWVFANVLMLLYAVLSFFIPSSSGMAVLSMPIMAPLAEVVVIPREIIVNAYQYGIGLMSFITPTGIILAALTMVKVTYDKWLKFVIPLLIILTLYTMIVLTISVYI